MVQLLRYPSACVLERNRVAFGINWAERLVNFNECTIRHLLDNAGFNTVLQYLAVGALQTNANAVGHEVRNRR